MYDERILDDKFKIQKSKFKVLVLTFDRFEIGRNFEILNYHPLDFTQDDTE